ncbi:hypothetical protein ACSF86_02510 [Moraxella bovoculi]|uniref:hypothetical protein n=1 Tax=Moraxella bovoculi TaxID=386891 RepID=UPI003F503CF2
MKRGLAWAKFITLAKAIIMHMIDFTLRWVRTTPNERAMDGDDKAFETLVMTMQKIR